MIPRPHQATRKHRSPTWKQLRSRSKSRRPAPYHGSARTLLSKTAGQTEQQALQAVHPPPDLLAARPSANLLTGKDGAGNGSWFA